MKITEFYHNKLSSNDNEIAKVGWNDIDKANLRYEFARNLIIANGSGTIVDVGCGLGTLTNFVKDINYIGIDLYKPYIDVAKKNYNGKFYCGNIIDVVKRNDIVADQYVSLGAYTIIDESIANTQKFIFDEVRFMISTAKKSVIVNGFHNVVDSKDYKYYHNINDWIQLSQEYSSTHQLVIHIFSKYEFFAEIKKIV